MWRIARYYHSAHKSCMICKLITVWPSWSRIFAKKFSVSAWRKQGGFNYDFSKLVDELVSLSMKVHRSWLATYAVKCTEVLKILYYFMCQMCVITYHKCLQRFKWQEEAGRKLELNTRESYHITTGISQPFSHTALSSCLLIEAFAKI